MQTYTPLHLLCLTAEQTHLCTAGVHYFGLYHFPEPYGGILEATLVVPLTAFGLRVVIPKGFAALGYTFHRVGDGCEAVSRMPEALLKAVMRAGKTCGRWLSKIGEYLQRDDLEK